MNGIEAIEWAERKGTDVWVYDAEAPEPRSQRVSTEHARLVASHSPTIIWVNTNNPDVPPSEYLRGDGALPHQ